MKRHIFRSLLLLHLIGLGLSIGTRLADFVIDRETSAGGLDTLSFGRELTGALARDLVLPGFLLMIATGIAMTLLRYGKHPPLWVWIKAGLTAAALLIATSLVAPALQGARDWARWSAAHEQLAPQFQDSAARAGLYGGIVFLLFVLNLPVAIWKPFQSVRLPRLLRAGAARSEG
jgi:hypothetical protein